MRRGGHPTLARPTCWHGSARIRCARRRRSRSSRARCTARRGASGPATCARATRSATTRLAKRAKARHAALARFERRGDGRRRVHHLIPDLASLALDPVAARVLRRAAPTATIRAPGASGGAARAAATCTPTRRTPRPRWPAGAAAGARILDKSLRGARAGRRADLARCCAFAGKRTVKSLAGRNDPRVRGRRELGLQRARHARARGHDDRVLPAVAVRRAATAPARGRDRHVCRRATRRRPSGPASARAPVRLAGRGGRAVADGVEPVDRVAAVTRRPGLHGRPRAALRVERPGGDDRRVVRPDGRTAAPSSGWPSPCRRLVDRNAPPDGLAGPCIAAHAGVAPEARAVDRELVHVALDRPLAAAEVLVHAGAREAVEALDRRAQVRGEAVGEREAAGDAPRSAPGARAGRRRARRACPRGRRARRRRPAARSAARTRRSPSASWLRWSQTWNRTRFGYSAASASQTKNACASSLYGRFSLTTRRPCLSTKIIESPATENMPDMSGRRATARSSGIGHIHACAMLRSCAPTRPRDPDEVALVGQRGAAAERGHAEEVARSSASWVNPPVAKITALRAPMRWVAPSGVAASTPVTARRPSRRAGRGARRRSSRPAPRAPR